MQSFLLYEGNFVVYEGNFVVFAVYEGNFVVNQQTWPKFSLFSYALCLLRNYREQIQLCKVQFLNRNAHFSLYLTKFSLFHFVFVIQSSKFVKLVFVFVCLWSLDGASGKQMLLVTGCTIQWPRAFGTGFPSHLVTKFDSVTSNR